MFRLLGILSFYLFISFLVALGFVQIKSDYFFTFLREGSMLFASALLAVNLTVHAIIMGQLNILVKKYPVKENYGSVIPELRQNAIGSIILTILISLFSFLISSQLHFTWVSSYNFGLEVFIFFFLVLLFVSLVETVRIIYDLLVF